MCPLPVISLLGHFDLTVGVLLRFLLRFAVLLPLLAFAGRGRHDGDAVQLQVSALKGGMDSRPGQCKHKRAA